jgi:hypothetical protein
MVARGVAQGGRIMKRMAGLVLVGGFALAGCSSMPSLDVLSGSSASSTVQIESEPPGAEARTSAGQSCRTPCALAVPPSDFTVTFSLNGYQPQTVPVRFASPDTRIDTELGSAPPPVIDPNPVYAELQPAAPAPRRPQRQPRKPKPKSTAAAPSAPASAEPAMDPSPAWPPAR